MSRKPYEPKKKKNLILAVAVALFAAAVAVLWFKRDIFGLSVSDMFIFTGLALLGVLFTALNYKRKCENYKRAKELQAQRKEMDNQDFSDNSIYFK